MDPIGRSDSEVDQIALLRFHWSKPHPSLSQPQHLKGITPRNSFFFLFRTNASINVRQSLLFNLECTADERDKLNNDGSQVSAECSTSWESASSCTIEAFCAKERSYKEFEEFMPKILGCEVIGQNVKEASLENFANVCQILPR